jgi:hypothetical protein
MGIIKKLPQTFDGSNTHGSQFFENQPSTGQFLTGLSGSVLKRCSGLGILF